MESFLLAEGPINWWPIEEGLIYHCRYALADFQCAYFDELGVPYADTLQRAVPKRQAEYLAGRYCAKRALSLLGSNQTVVQSGHRRQPIWPTGVVGSISHSNEAAIACVSRCPNIIGLGIDLEENIKTETMEKIESSILTERDRRWLSETNLAKEQLFTIIFSLKESFFKAVFSQVKKYFDFDAVSIKHIDEDNNTLQFQINYNLSESIVAGQIYQGKYRTWINNMVVTFIEIKSDNQ